MNRRVFLNAVQKILPAAALFFATRGAARADIVPALDKSAVGYQDVPRNGAVCAQCVYFAFHPATAAGPGSRCKLVAGPISPAGWCEVFQPKA